MAIVDADVAARFGWTMTDLAAAYLSGGATLLQLRAKQAPSGWLLETATAIVALAHQAHAIVVVNDRADVARMSGADGVHVGQDDLTPAAVRQIVGAAASGGAGVEAPVEEVDTVIGLSTHTAEQLEAALHSPVSYIAVGPIYGTSTKATGYTSLGLEPLRRAAARTREKGVPLVAIGGVTLQTAPDVIRAGASTVAVISDLVGGGDPAARVRAYLACLTV